MLDAPAEVREPVLERLTELWNKISTTPATSAAGAREQVLRAITIHELGSIPGDPELAGLRSAASATERLAEESRAFAELRARLVDLRRLRSQVGEGTELFAVRLAELGPSWPRIRTRGASTARRGRLRPAFRPHLPD
jgi:hypothetical protein